MKNNKRHNGGFTLVEVLVAVVIISIGLLGMAGIQIKGLRGTQSSNLKGQATIVANDIAERIHANLGGVPDGNLNTDYSNVDVAQLACENAPAQYCSSTADAPADNCTPTQMATFDIFVWGCGTTDNDGVKNLLPGGTATITCTDLDPADTIVCSPGSSLNINITWDEIDPKDGNALNRNLRMAIVP